MADNDFALETNASAAAAAENAVAEGNQALAAGASGGKGQAKEDFEKEFDLPTGQPGAKKKKPESELNVKLGDDDDESDDDEGLLEDELENDDDTDESDDDDAADDDDSESVENWLKDIDTDTRQEILNELLKDGKLKLTVRQNGQDQELGWEDVKRAAGGYAGETAAETRFSRLKSELEAREQDVKTREDFFTKQLSDPTDLMNFLDAHVEDPVRYFGVVKEFAETLLTEAESDPAAFRRSTALRRENAQLRQQVQEIHSMLKGNGRDTGKGDDEGAADAQKAAEQEGLAREDFVKKAGFDVSEVAEAWTTAGKPKDFYRWFAGWSLQSRRGTPKGESKKATKKARRKGGALRRRGSAGAGGSGLKPDTSGKFPTVAEISAFLQSG